MGEQEAQRMSSSSSSLYLSQDSLVRYKKRKANFSFSEVHILLDEVRKNRHIVVGKFNYGIPSEVKRRKWAEITERVNEIGECDREISEVIKKWSDLKCDTKRKVAALRSGNVPPLASLSQSDLSPTEAIIKNILELDHKSSSSSTSASPSPRTARSQSRASGELDMSAPVEEEEDEEGLLGAGSVHSSPVRGGESRIRGPAAKVDAADPDSHLMDSDDDQHDVLPSSSSRSSVAEDNGTHTNTNATHVSSSSSSSNNANAQQPPPPPPHHSSSSSSAPMMLEPDAVREQLAQSASLSLQEQHTTNALLGTVSRSLELLAESAQQLAETQQEYARESLQLQRETVQVLREFAAGALSLLHEKVNGKPPLF